MHNLFPVALRQVQLTESMSLKAKSSSQHRTINGMPFICVLLLLCVDLLALCAHAVWGVLNNDAFSCRNDSDPAVRVSIAIGLVDA